MSPFYVGPAPGITQPLDEGAAQAQYQQEHPSAFDELHAALEAFQIAIGTAVLDGPLAFMSSIKPKPKTEKPQFAMVRRPPSPPVPPPARSGDLRQSLPRAATGPTQRLPRLCRACGDVLPDGAAFCITCAAPVEGR